MHLPTFSTRSFTTPQARGPGQASKVREGRRMASSLRRQAHDESHQRIAAQVRSGPLTQNDHEHGSGPSVAGPSPIRPRRRRWGTRQSGERRRVARDASTADVSQPP